MFSSDIYPALNHTMGQDDPPPDDLALALSTSPCGPIQLKASFSRLSFSMYPKWKERTMRNEILAPFNVICGL